MKRIIALVALMICFAGLYSQVTLHFCASVDPQYGYCNFDNLKFITSPDSTRGKLFMEVRSVSAPIGASNVIFKIYKLEADGKETFLTVLQEAIKPEWYAAWMPNVFDSPGKYTVKIYNESDQFICSNSFEFIQYK